MPNPDDITPDDIACASAAFDLCNGPHHIAFTGSCQGTLARLFADHRRKAVADDPIKVFHGPRKCTQCGGNWWEP